MSNDFNKFLGKIHQWAMNQSSIIGLALVGSYANNSAHDKSDIDLMIISDNSSEWFNSNDWLRSFGEVDNVNVEDWGEVKTLRVFYKDSYEVEFNYSSRKWCEINPIDLGTRKVVNDGIRIIYDPVNLFENLVRKLLK